MPYEDTALPLSYAGGKLHFTKIPYKRQRKDLRSAV